MRERDAWTSENPLLAPREDDSARMEAFLEACFHSSTLGFCILDAELRYVTINQTLARINGMPPEAHVGRTIREVLGPFADQVEPDLRRVLATPPCCPPDFWVCGPLGRKDRCTKAR
jgi:PAS domain-containing protein